MRRKKHLFWLAAVGLFVLVGVAAATQPHPQTADVSAAFTADQTRSHSRTCTQDGNTFRITNAVWRGTSTSAEPRLVRQPRHLDAHRPERDHRRRMGLRYLAHDRDSAPMKPGKGGEVECTSLRPSSTTATISTASRRERFGRPWARLLGNWSATVIGNTLSGELGANAPVAPDNSALLYRGGC